MAKFDPKKDEALYSAEAESGLQLSVRSYNGGAPKLQIGPRKVGESEGVPVYRKAGRLSCTEFQWVLTHAEAITLACEEGGG